MRGFIARIFWSEARRERERPRSRHPVKCEHPALRAIAFVATIAGAVLTWVPQGHAAVRISALGVLAVLLCAQGLDALTVHRRRQLNRSPQARLPRRESGGGYGS